MSDQFWSEAAGASVLCTIEQWRRFQGSCIQTTQARGSSPLARLGGKARVQLHT